MKKIKLFALGTLLVCLSINSFSQTPDVKVEREPEMRLEPVERGGGRPFMEVLNERQSIRQFSERELEPRILSALLWAANGINRDAEGKRTAPSTRDVREIDVYMLTPHGAYLYIPEGHGIKLIKPGDYRKEVLPKAEFAHQAPVVLVYVANSKKLESFEASSREFYSAVDCGFVSQNVYLYCASEHLATVVLGSVNKEALGKILGLVKDKVLLAQPVGYRD
ncbi:MAG: SagB/ThcOx family dehydrogenase [Bacteroidales bacterium]|jgi:SagB-type dehydrogenase family enzyme|nr:SagB/ThcOx family dehydrogenase [Bacteroidales bacterium]